MNFIFIFRVFALLFSFILYFRGFFPYKQVSRGYESEKVSLFSMTDSPLLGFHTNLTNQSHVPDNLPYQRVILLIIDALRADFAFGPLNYIPETSAILDNGHGFQFIAEAHPPTVTLPRIKAITTGSTPSFVDVVLNFGSPALEEDNLISQLKINGRHVIFFGDDTWMSLFPNHFERSDGTTSFFVSDYTEVDVNVTRHLRSELDKPTWDVMILHYLGLDHIGHMAGPSSPLIQPKLAEMDKVIRQIYTAMEKWSEPSLLVVCGDHGMSDQGGHGGASAGEISVPVLFLSPHITFQDTKHIGAISQIDLCPTLSILMDLPIPKNNLGKIITDVLVDFSLQQKVQVLQHNCHQSMQILKGYVQDVQKESSFLLYVKAEEQVRTWLSSQNFTPVAEWESQGLTLLTLYSESLTLLAERVGKLATQYDVYAMSIAMLLLWMLLISLVLSHMHKSMATSSAMTLAKYISLLVVASSTAVLTHITMCTCGVPSDLVCQPTTESIALQLTTGFTFVGCLLDIVTEWSHCCPLATQLKKLWANSNFIQIFLLVGTVAHTFTLLSSSFVEEEHQTFYFLTNTIHLLLLIQIIIWYFIYKTYQQNSEVTKGADSHKRNYQKQNDTLRHSVMTDKYTVNYSADSVPSMRNKTNKEYSYKNSEHFVSETSSRDRGISQSQQPPQYHSKKDEDMDQAAIPGYTTTNDQRGKICRCSPNTLVHFTVSLVAVLVILRILRRWNQTGNKWLDIPDFGDWLILPENKNYLSLLVLFSLMVLALTRGSHLLRVQSMCVNLSLAAIYLYRVADGNLFFPSTRFLSSRGILEARAAFLFIGANLFISLLPNFVFRLDAPETKKSQTPSNAAKNNSTVARSFKEKTSRSNLTLRPSTEETSDHHQLQTLEQTKSLPVVSGNDKGVSSMGSDNDNDEGCVSYDERLRDVIAAFLCFMCLVMRPHNVPIVVAMSLIEQMMTPVLLHCALPPTYTLLYCLWMGQAFFFFQGNSNSLSTVELTAGYTGLHDFMPGVTGCLLCLSTYSATIFWSLTFLRIFAQLPDNLEDETSISKWRVCSPWTTLLLSRALPLSVYTALTSAQRYHLFVWTVFSPKLLYEGVYTGVISALALLLYIWMLITRLASSRNS